MIPHHNLDFHVQTAPASWATKLARYGCGVFWGSAGPLGLLEGLLSFACFFFFFFMVLWGVG